MRPSLPLILVLSLFLAACSGPKETPLPRELGKMDSIKGAMEKLPENERGLVSGYIVRHTIGAAFAGMVGDKSTPQGIPEGMTLGKAIEDQRQYLASQAAEEAKQKALKDKLAAEHEAAVARMRDAVSVTLVSKSLHTEKGYGGMELDESLVVKFGYKNNTDKTIAGVKGTVTIQDLFGDKISAFGIANDATIKAKDTATWTGSRSVKFAMGGNKDRKLADLPEEKFKVIWEPEAIVFSDGTKLTAPE